MKGSKPLLFVLLTFLASCTKTRPDEVVAMDGAAIELSQVDNAVKHQLYERLYDIYKIRKIALNQILEASLLSRESQSRNISTDSLIHIEVKSKITPENLAAFVRDHELDKGVSKDDNPFVLYSIETQEGKEILAQLYSRFLKDRLIDTLKSKYNVKINLPIPKAPALTLDVMKYALQTTEQPSLQIDYIADVDCNHCREGFFVIEKLMKEYKREANFHFVPLIETPTFSSRVAHATNKREKFTSFFSLICRNHAADSAQYTQSALSVGLEPDDLIVPTGSDLKKSLNDNFTTLISNNIGTTPTVIVNGQIYYGMVNYDDLKEFIDGIKDN